MNRQSFSTLQNTIVLAQLLAGLYKEIYGFGIELEHVVVTGNHQSRTDVVGQLRGFIAKQVARDAAFKSVPIDGQQGHIDLEGSEQVGHARVP
jgi:hypothetical protein